MQFICRFSRTRVKVFLRLSGERLLSIAGLFCQHRLSTLIDLLLVSWLLAICQHMVPTTVPTLWFESVMYMKYSKCLKTSNPLFHTFFLCVCVFFPLIFAFYAALSFKMFSRMENSVDLDQTAPLGAVWSGSALFAYAIFSRYFTVVIIYSMKINPWCIIVY